MEKEIKDIKADFTDDIEFVERDDVVRLDIDRLGVCSTK